MIPLLLLVIVILTSSCRSHKNLHQEKFIAVDSMAMSERRHSILTVDSLIRHIDFRFDTLKISIEPDSPKVIRLTATNGRITDSRRLTHRRAEHSDRLDTLAYHLAAAEASAERADATRLYNPPDGTAVAFVALILAAALLVFLLRRKRFER